MPRLLIQAGPLAGHVLELQRGTNSLGRAAGNDFALEEASVSSRHCEVVVTDFSVRVRDLHSTNGTFVDHQPVQEGELRDGQLLTLGGLLMRLEIEPVHVAVPTLPPPESTAPPLLPDGTPACQHHPDTIASFKCEQCERTFCEACTRVLRLVGGRTRLFCPVCSGVCRPLGSPAIQEKRKSAVAQLWETLRLPFRRPPPPS